MVDLMAHTTQLLGHLVDAPLHDLPVDLAEVRSARERRDVQRDHGASAHGVYIGKRVCCGDRTEPVGIVHDRREEVDGLHQRRPCIPPVHTPIVSGPVINQDPGVGVQRNAAQDPSELACGEFARSTRAADHLGQSLRHLVHQSHRTTTWPAADSAGSKICRTRRSRRLSPPQVTPPAARGAPAAQQACALSLLVPLLRIREVAADRSSLIEKRRHTRATCP